MFHSRKTFHKLFLFIPIHYLAKIVGDTHFCSALYFAPRAVFCTPWENPIMLESLRHCYRNVRK